MRFLLGLLLVAACGARTASGPAWPKSADKEIDGGESLEPRTPAASVVTGKDDDDKDKGKDKTEVAKATDKPATGDKPATTNAAQPSVGEPRPVDDVIITTEEIVIEIDE
jgi:hypothetical protein